MGNISDGDKAKLTATGAPTTKGKELAGRLSLDDEGKVTIDTSSETPVENAARVAREAAETRGAVGGGGPASKPKENERPAFHILPNMGMEHAALDSGAWLEKRTQEEEEIRARHSAEEDEKYFFYLKCRNGAHRIDGRLMPPHGVYFTKNPGSAVVGDNDWDADYKREAGGIWGQDIMCQVCLKMGRQDALLPVIWVDRRKRLWKPEPRWLWMAAKDVKVWEAEGGDHRAVDLPQAANNMWRGAVAERVG